MIIGVTYVRPVRGTTRRVTSYKPSYKSLLIRMSLQVRVCLSTQGPFTAQYSCGIRSKTMPYTSTRQPPVKIPRIPTNRDHKALNRGTSGGLGMVLQPLFQTGARSGASRVSLSLSLSLSLALSGTACRCRTCLERGLARKTH